MRLQARGGFFFVAFLKKMEKQPAKRRSKMENILSKLENKRKTVEIHRKTAKDLLLTLKRLCVIIG